MKKSFKLVFVVVLSVVLVLIGGCNAKPAANAAKAQNRLQAILDRGYLEVVTEPYFAPNEFIDPSKSGNDKYVGSDIELAKYIAAQLGVELRIIPLEFSAVLSSITEGKYDLAISALAYTPARSSAMLLSKGYYFAKDTPGNGLLIRQEAQDKIQSAEDLANAIVVVQSGSLQEVFANEQIPKLKELKRVSATTDGILMVQEQKADACIVSKAMAQLYIDANPDSGLAIVENFTFVVDPELDGSRIGMPLGETELADRINQIIGQVVSSGQYDEWYRQYTEYAKKLGL